MTDIKDSLDEFTKMVWGKRSEGLPVPELDLKREITAEELSNIQEKYAFVQILNPEASGEFTEIRFIKARSGWVILDYQNAMAASPGEMLFEHGTYVTPEAGAGMAEAGTLERVCSGKGTIILQIINTAAEMVRIAKEHHWPTIFIVNGHSRMKYGIWKAGQDLQIPVTGFVPSKEEEAKYQRIQKICPSLLEPAGIEPKIP